MYKNSKIDFESMLMNTLLEGSKRGSKIMEACIFHAVICEQIDFHNVQSSLDTFEQTEHSSTLRQTTLLFNLMCCIFSIPAIMMTIPLVFATVFPILGSLLEFLPFILFIILCVKLVQCHISPEEKKKMKEMKEKWTEKVTNHTHMHEHQGVIETHNAFHVDIELPGVKKEDINVETEGNLITVTCPRYRRDYHSEGKQEKICDYKRCIRLPETANMDNVLATYENGILYLLIEKKPEFAEQKKNIVIQ